MKTATNIALSCVAGLLTCACVMNSNQTTPTDTLTNTSANSPAAAMPQKAGQATPLVFQDPRPTECKPTLLVDGVARGECVATIINTNTFNPQIQDAPPKVEGMRKGAYLPPHKMGRVIPDGEPNTLVAPIEINDTQIEPGEYFTGIGNSGWTPPDCTLAVGPNHVVATANSQIAFFTKTGTKTFQVALDSTGAPGFFEPVGASTFVFDPKCIYDQHSNRFIVISPEQYSSTSTAYMDIAISDDSDPNGTWYKYRTSCVVTIGTTKYWVDYPGLGVDANGIYITGNLFGFTSGFAGAWFRSFDKTPLLTGGTAVYADVNYSSSSSVQVASAFPDAKALFVSRASSTSMRLHSIANPFTSPVVSIKAVTVASNAAPPTAPVRGSTTGTLDTLDGRMMNANIRDGKLYAAHCISSSSKAAARWYQVNLNNWPITTTATPTLGQSGTILPSTGESTFFPAIAANARGDVAVAYGASSLTVFPNVSISARRALDTNGTMSQSTMLATGSTSPTTAGNRWGDYFGIAVDPVNDCTFWCIGETGGSSWSTAINSFSVEQSADVDGSGGVDSADLSVMLLSFGPCPCCVEDIDNSGEVDSSDVSRLLLEF
jgi:hypothetical protein